MKTNLFSVFGYGGLGLSRRLFHYIQDYYNKKRLISKLGDRKEAYYL